MCNLRTFESWAHYDDYLDTPGVTLPRAGDVFYIDRRVYEYTLDRGLIAARATELRYLRLLGQIDWEDDFV